MEHQWHYDYARLAWDAGFVFGNYHPSNLDKSKLSLLDVDRIVNDRDITTVEQYIPLVMHYVLEEDQAEILDSNFVKIFRISQLAIEYLLFCKKYLDNTVILLKKESARLKQQQNKFKQYDGDPGLNICTPRREFLTAVYKCDKCDKAFSTENYLNSHIKRRHTDENISNDNEDKLQLEIKELKERLNSTDKLLQQINVLEPPVGNKNTGQNPLTDLEKKFCSFREQVENEISSLHLEKNMYEEKYNKLFDLMLQTKLRSNVVVENVGTMTSDNNVVIRATNQIQCVHVSTQTEQLKQTNLKQETVQILSLNNHQETDQSFQKYSHDHQDRLEEKFSTLGENIDNQVSTSIDPIKNQMKIIWEEKKKEHQNQEKSHLKDQKTFLNEHDLVQSKDTDEEQTPQVKPRTKLQSSKLVRKPQPRSVVTSVETTQVRSTHDHNESESVALIPQNIEDMKADYVSKLNHKILEIKTPKYIQDNGSLSEIESVESFDESASQITMPQKNERSHSHDQMSGMDKVIKIIEERFPGSQSPLFLVSQNNFHRAMEILSGHPEISNKETSCSELKMDEKYKHIKAHKTASKANLVKIRLKKVSRRKDGEKSTSILAIKNKALYETDSENEIISPRKKEMEHKMDQRSPTSELKSFLKEVEPTNTHIRKKVLFETFQSSDEHNDSYLENMFRVGFQNKEKAVQIEKI